MNLPADEQRRMERAVRLTKGRPHPTLDPLGRSRSRARRLELLAQDIRQADERRKLALLEVGRLCRYEAKVVLLPEDIVAAWYDPASYDACPAAIDAVIGAGRGLELFRAMEAAGILDPGDWKIADRHQPTDDELRGIFEDYNDYLDSTLVTFWALLGVAASGLIRPRQTNALLAAWRIVLTAGEPEVVTMERALRRPEDFWTMMVYSPLEEAYATRFGTLLDAIVALTPADCAALADAWRHTNLDAWRQAWGRLAEQEAREQSWKTAWTVTANYWKHAGHPVPAPPSAGYRAPSHASAFDAFWSATLALSAEPLLSPEDFVALSAPWVSVCGVAY